MDGRGAFAANLRRNERPRVERRVLELIDHGDGPGAAHAAGHAPEGGREGLPRRRVKGRDLAVSAKAQGEQLVTAIVVLHVIENCGTAVGERAA